MIKVEVITPSGTVYAGEGSQVVVPGEKAPFAVLPRHQAIVSTLIPEGVVRVDHSGQPSTRLRVQGMCVVEFHADQLSILADRAQLLAEG